MANSERPDSPQQPPTPPPPAGGGQIPLGAGGGGKNLIPINIEDEMRRSYLDYAMSVIIGRALPDVRDGLKPVHRRILYGMHEMGLTFNRPTRKCAKIVGEVLGKYHPHGDAAVYDALVRMAQPFSMRYPLIEGQGNFGSVDGDPPAAMRYTEARLARIAGTMLADIDRETVDFRPNYDDSEQEPEVLPARVPNLLINGSSGIAVGMATNIPPHNLKEIIDATIALVQNPNTPLEKILELVPGPDFPTGGYILGKQGVIDAYTKGRGMLKLRAKAAIEHVGKDRDQIVVTEIPYQVNKSRLIEQVASLVNEKKLDGISEIRDESDREGMRIVFELKRGEQAEVVLNNLYKHTQMQTGFGVIMLSIVNGQPRELGLIDCIKRFIDHRVDVIRRRTEHDLRKAREREHVLLGFKKALEHLDLVIETIRASSTPKEARERLMGVLPIPERVAREVVVPEGFVFDFSERQAQAIIELQLQRLTGMEQQKILDELAEIQRRIAEYLEILGSEKVLRNVIIKELREVQKEFGDERRTQFLEDTGEIRLEDLVAVEDVAVTVTHGGYLKRTPVDTYRRQSRGGKGRIGMGTRNEDFVEHLIVASTHAYLLIFTNKGRVYWLKIYEIPDAGTASKGKHISNLINLQPEETIKGFLPVRDFVPDKYVVMVTRRGVIKKCGLTEFDNPMSRGIIAITLDEGDELIAAGLSSGNDYIFLGSYQGKAIRFHEDQVRAMGRPARGVRAMSLAEGDHLVGMEIAEEECLILSVSEKGFGKRTPLKDYRLTARGGKGVINMKTTARVGNVVSVMAVKDDTDVMIITKEGKIIRLEASEIRQAGRSTQGVRLVRMEESDRVAAACVIPEDHNGNGNGRNDNGNGQEKLPL
ncbi:MAG TPA: DNA gyrase subunit A [Bryobacteraceae bacterium]|nr:DNA gyrase subunit A [Bryobacteraceae bacterium]HOQ44839.1 DNA gyrase subunit A [Bryobacteraceae bacterium]HPU72150.1 DNA gyrase subunit A [Bryobacteraceae bacterium]